MATIITEPAPALAHLGGSMRIAQVAPLVESVPPAGYGGTERVVAYLTDFLFPAKRAMTPIAPARPSIP